MGRSRAFLVPLALSHHYSVPHAHLAIFGHHAVSLSHYYSVPLALSRSFSLFLAITPFLSLTLTITRLLTLFFGPSPSISLLLDPPRAFLVTLAHSHYYSVSHTHSRNLWPLHGLFYSLPLFLAISGHHTAPLTSSHSFLLFLAITRPLSFPPAPFRYFGPSHGLSHSLQVRNHKAVSPSRQCVLRHRTLSPGAMFSDGL